MASDELKLTLFMDLYLSYLYVKSGKVEGRGVKDVLGNNQF